METLKLTHAGAQVSLEPPAARTREKETANVLSGEEVRQARFDGLFWTWRNGFDRLLSETPSASWRQPQAAGWTLVKHNGPREVWRAMLQGRNFYLKYYVQPRGFAALKLFLRDPACLAEWNGGLYALQAGIPAACPSGYVFDVRRERRRWALLVTEAIEPSCALNEHWRLLQGDTDLRRSLADRAALIETLARMIARAHQAGFEHLDMHASNILVQSLAPRTYRTVFIDLHSARLGVPISDRAVVRNLAQLNQWFHRHSTIGERLRFLAAYMRWRNEYEHAFPHARPLGLRYEQLVHALVVAADTHAQRLWARRDRRGRRDGRYFARMKVSGGWTGMAMLRSKHPSEGSRASELEFDAEWWKEQLRDPLAWFAADRMEACKRSHSALVARAVLPHPDGPLPVIVKRPLARNWRRGLSQALRSSRSDRGWRVGHALLNRDLATARPLAYLERRVGPFVVDSLLITEALPGAVDLHAHLCEQQAQLAPHAWRALKLELLTMLVRKIRRLHERGFLHRDCKAQNILVLESPQRRLAWIDMDGIRHLGRQPRPDVELRPLGRLHVSLLDVPGLTRTDRARFLKDYFARFGSDPSAWRVAWRELSRQAAQKLRAKRARRAWKLARYGRE